MEPNDNKQNMKRLVLLSYVDEWVKVVSPSDNLLVGFGFVQPNAADEGADHPRNDNGEANPPSIHLFPLKGVKEDRA